MMILLLTENDNGLLIMSQIHLNLLMRTICLHEFSDENLITKELNHLNRYMETLRGCLHAQFLKMHNGI